MTAIFVHKVTVLTNLVQLLSSYVLPLLNFVDVALQVNCCMEYITWICSVFLLYLKESASQLWSYSYKAYSFHKAGRPLRSAYTSSCFGQIWFVRCRKLCFVIGLGSAYVVDMVVVHCWRMGLVPPSLRFLVFYLVLQCASSVRIVLQLHLDFIVKFERMEK